MNAVRKFFLNQSIASRIRAYDSGHDEDRAVNALNWDAIIAATLVIGTGACFWGGVGLMIARLWR